VNGVARLVLLLSEQQDVRDRLRKGGRVDDHEGPCARGEAAWIARAHLLFAGAGLALDEDGEVLRRNALERGEELPHRGRPADEPTKRLAIGRRGGHRGFVDLEPERRVADHDLGADRELDVVHAMVAEPRAVRAADVACRERDRPHA
jgi:hypothetical protein